MIVKESIPIELGGKTRYLRYGWGALELVEETFGISILEVGKLLASQSLKLKDLRNILWAGLAHDEDKGLTQEEVKEMLEGYDLIELTVKISKALELAFTSEESKKKKMQAQTQDSEASKKS